MTPFSGSVYAMVSGMRSPVSLALRITNWPGLAFRAMRGAGISLRTTVPWDISSRLTILNMTGLQGETYMGNSDDFLRVHHFQVKGDILRSKAQNQGQKIEFRRARW